MKPSDFLTPDLIRLNLQSSTKEEVLKELVWMLDVREEYRPILLDMVLQREALGSTGLGECVAIPHGRSLREVSNQYLPLLGSIAKLASDPENIERLRNAETPEQCLEFLEQICS